ncbi:MAG: protein-L-isoaspartate O-methyltransferase [Rhizobiales bacterium]|nr:protein-L-isoaspartate O-methyltransferase [Hyphomicrobiales bacterium]
MIDSAVQRENMVESQVRTYDVTDRRVIRAMQEVAREQFVPAAMKSLAYMDEELVVAGSGSSARALPRPMVHARLIQLAGVEADDLVLEVGTLTGYGAALLARIAGGVVSLEVDAELSATANEALARIGALSVSTVTGPLEDGYAAGGPYDAIIFNGCVEFVPETFAAQLKPGARLVAIVGEGGAGRATVFEAAGGRLSGRAVFSCSGPVLPGFRRPRGFVF